MPSKIRFIILVAILTCPYNHLPQAYAQTSAALDQGASRQEFRDFQSLRTELLAKIGSATKRVWIATDFLTDAEIVSSLFIAQYRKVNISVLLGKEWATNILSRLNYLKQVNIPVALRPKDFYPKTPSIMLIDNSVLAISTILDAMQRPSSKISLDIMPSGVLPDFEAKFGAAALLQNAPKMAPLPQVGRVRPNAKYYRGNASVNPIRTPESQPIDNSSLKTKSPSPLGDQGDGELSRLSRPRAGETSPTQRGPELGESYRYQSRRDKAPEGVPTRLPKTTLRQELERERGRLHNLDTAPSSNAD